MSSRCYLSKKHVDDYLANCVGNRISNGCVIQKNTNMIIDHLLDQYPMYRDSSHDEQLRVKTIYSLTLPNQIYGVIQDEITVCPVTGCKRYAVLWAAEKYLPWMKSNKMSDVYFWELELGSAQQKV